MTIILYSQDTEEKEEEEEEDNGTAYAKDLLTGDW